MILIIVKAVIACYWAYKYFRSDDQLKKIEYMVMFGIMVCC